MSRNKIHNVGPPELSTETTTEEFQIDNITSTDITLTSRSRERSPEEKLAILRKFIKRKYSL
ncbi:MAG: hypothetical protein ACLQPD_02465 [Desulfomonilaceae bacterium]